MHFVDLGVKPAGRQVIRVDFTSLDCQRLLLYRVEVETDRGRFTDGSA